MAEIGRWNGHTFEVSPTMILGFTGLTVKGSCETKDKTKSKQKYVTRKNGKPSEVNLTIVLHVNLGCDVRTEAMKFISDATAGAKDYFYVGNSKLLACKLMLVDASIKEATIGDGNNWIHAQVSLTMKQCDKGGTSSSSSKKKTSKKKSTKKSSTKKKKTTKKKSTKSSGGVDAVTGAAPSVSKKNASTVKKVVSTATKTIKKIVTAAKKLTSKLKKR